MATLRRQSSGSTATSLSSIVEAKSEVSLEVAVQTLDTVLDDVIEAHRIGLADRMLEQILSGDGVGQ